MAMLDYARLYELDNEETADFIHLAKAMDIAYLEYQANKTAAEAGKPS